MADCIADKVLSYSEPAQVRALVLMADHRGRLPPPRKAVHLLRAEGKKSQKDEMPNPAIEKVHAKADELATTVIAPRSSREAAAAAWKDLLALPIPEVIKAIDTSPALKEALLQLVEQSVEKKVCERGDRMRCQVFLDFKNVKMLNDSSDGSNAWASLVAPHDKGESDYKVRGSC